MPAGRAAPEVIAGTVRLRMECSYPLCVDGHPSSWKRKCFALNAGHAHDARPAHAGSCMPAAHLFAPPLLTRALTRSLR
jgi:hypothetical protein